jgi:hypothetical protein
VSARDGLYRFKRLLSREQAEIARLKQRLAEAEKALEFYASPISWDWHLQQVEIVDDSANATIDDSDCSVPIGLCDARGGKRAREYFEKWRTGAEGEK